MAKQTLRLICVGTGRDGTQSLAHMLRALFEETGGRGSVAHEYRSREFSHAFANLRETGDEKWLKELHQLIDGCPHECIIGNGYAPILSLFAERCPGVGLIHLRRTDRDACIASLADNCRIFPTAYVHYSSSPEATSKRMAAFHFGEMDRAAWETLSTRDRLAWYFDKTHSLIDTQSPKFDRGMDLRTEDLALEDSRRRLALFAIGDDRVLPPAAHLNRHAPLDGLDAIGTEKLQWLMGRFDYRRAASSDTYPIEYFLNEFVAWTGYQIGDAPQISAVSRKTRKEIAATLEKAESVLTEHLANVKSLRKLAEPQAAAARSPADASKIDARLQESTGDRGEIPSVVNKFFETVLRGRHNSLSWGDRLLTLDKSMGFRKDARFEEAFASIKKSHEYDQYGGPDEIIWRLNTLVWAARTALWLPGDFVECGVFKGDMSWVVANSVGFADAAKTFYLYDTFEGYCPRYSSAADFDMNSTFFDFADKVYKIPGLFETVRARFSGFRNVKVIKGVLPDVLKYESHDQIAYLHIDLNSPAAETGVLLKLFDRVVPGGVIVFDDYGWLFFHKQKEAVDSFMSERGHEVLELPSGQGLVVKRSEVRPSWFTRFGR